MGILGDRSRNSNGRLFHYWPQQSSRNPIDRARDSRVVQGSWRAYGLQVYSSRAALRVGAIRCMGETSKVEWRRAPGHAHAWLETYKSNTPPLFPLLSHPVPLSLPLPLPCCQFPSPTTAQSLSVSNRLPSFVSSPCGKFPLPHFGPAKLHHREQQRQGRGHGQGEKSLEADKPLPNSGIFGYINYLVEKDRKYILDTLINGECGAT